MTENDKGTTIPAQSYEQKRKEISIPEKWMLTGIGFIIFILVYAVISLVFEIETRGATAGIVGINQNQEFSSVQRKMIHPFPDTGEGIHVFADQLATWEMSEAQFQFASMHYAGTQKVFASDARRLRSHNSDFVILNYRLGLGLGYQSMDTNCDPTGAWVQVIEGEKWVREWPQTPQEEWFYKLNGDRVVFCQWGWYLMNPSNSSWRDYWAAEVIRQIQTNQADGVFVDGLFPPNHYGGEFFKPDLPAMDKDFENAWSMDIERFILFGQSGELTDYHFIANVGYWLTGRDITNYSQTDGIMIEGFGRWTNGAHFSESEGDWQLQMDRILSMVNLDRIVILQQYVDQDNLEDRLFLLGNYLLIKGSHTYLNLELSPAPEWFPEYEIPIGSTQGGIPASISSLWRSDWGVYARSFTNGLVLVNPSGQSKNVELFQNYYQVIPFGGGVVPANGDISGWTIDYAQVSRINVGAHQAAILLVNTPKE